MIDTIVWFLKKNMHFIVSNCVFLTRWSFPVEIFCVTPFLPSYSASHQECLTGARIGLRTHPSAGSSVFFPSLWISLTHLFRCRGHLPPHPCSGAQLMSAFRRLLGSRSHGTAVTTWPGPDSTTNEWIWTVPLNIQKNITPPLIACLWQPQGQNCRFKRKC